MRWLGNYVLELLRGPWPELWFIRHGHGMHQIGREMADKGMAKSPKEAWGIDIPNHLIPLSPLGRWQAEEIRKHLNVKPDCIYTSQIRRAYETAKIIFPNYPIRQDPRLNEKDFGPAHMLSKDELENYFPIHYQRYRIDGKYWASKAPGGESYPYLSLRLHSMLDTFRRDWAGKCLVIFCHQSVMVSARQLLERFSPEELLRIAKEQWIDNCGILNYSRPGELWGWRKGKFRLQLARPPYKLWSLSKAQEQIFWDKAMCELGVLRQEFTK